MITFHFLLSGRSPAVAANCSEMSCGLLSAWCIALALVACWNPSTGCAADSAEDSAGVPAVGYRRVFVPAGDVAAWPRDGQKYLPIESSEFHELVAAANQLKDGSNSQAVITDAVYTGRLRGDGNIAGSGAWTVQLRGGRPVILPLGEYSLAIRNPRWRDEPQRPMRLGRWGARGAPASDLGLDVTRSGTVEFEWHVAALSAKSGRAPFWRLPRASNSRLSLDLPAEYQPIVEGGVILRPVVSASNSAANSGGRNWEIALGPSPDAALKVTTTDDTLVEPAAEGLLREYTVYRINERGMEIEATLSVDDVAAQLDELVVPLPTEVQFLSAEADGKELAWRVTTRARTANATAVISLPESSSRGLAVTIRAWHPLVTRRDWQLPKLRPQGMFWSSGEIELSVAPMLELQQLVPTDCLQTGVVSSNSDSTGPETCWLTAYTPLADVKVSIAPRVAEVLVRQGLSLSLVEPIVNGRMVSEIQVSRGSMHTLSADIAEGWNLEGVETIPASALGEWFLNRNGQGNHLEVQLSQAASPARNVKVIVTANRQRPDPSEVLSTDALRMVRWRGAEVSQHLVAFQTAEPIAAEPIEGLLQATAEQLSGAADLLLSAADSQGTAFDLAPAPNGAALRLSPKRGEYDAYATLEATLDGDSVQQTYRMQIAPQNSRIDEILVFSSAPLGEEVAWKDETTGNPIAAKRLADSDPLRGELPREGEAWLVRLLHPTTREFSLIATRTASLSQRAQVALLSVPQAVHQEGRVFLRGGQVAGPTVETERLQPIPSPIDGEGRSDSSQTLPVQAAYRYEPAHCVDAARCPRLWLGPGDARARARPIARSAELESFFSADGRAVHRAKYQLASVGAEQFDYRPPIGATNVAVSVDARTVATATTTSDAKAIPIRLSKSGRPVGLVIQFETQQPALRAGAELYPPLTDEIQVSSGTWTVWLPAEITPASNDSSSLNENTSLRRRLFGPLGRSLDASVFRTFEGDDWITLAAQATESIRLQADSTPQSAAVEKPPGLNSPRAELQTSPENQIGSDGWRGYRTTFVAAGPPPLTIAQSPTTTTWAIATFLLCLVSGGWLVSRSRQSYLMCVAIAAVAALVLPATFAPIATGVFLGLLASMIPLRSRTPVSDETPTKTWNHTTAISVIALVAAVASFGQALAQPPANAEQQVARVATDRPENGEGSGAANPPQPAVIHPIMIPTDANGRPVGTKWYVGEQLLRALFDSAQSEPATNRDWLLRDVTCDGELREGDDDSSIVAGEWKLTLSLEVMARETTIVLPLVQREANWAAQATLDGIPAAILWKGDGRCEIQVTEPGRYDLAISFVPRIVVVGDRQQIELTLPAAIGGRTLIRYPATLRDLETTGADPASQSDSTPGSLIRELDGSGQITVAWPRVGSSPNETQGLRASELYWLRFDGDDIWLGGKYIVEGGTSRPQTLTVAYDPLWQLVSSEVAIASYPVESGERRTVRVALPPDDIDRQEVTVHWRLAQTVPLGNSKLPPIALASLPVTQRWFAVSSGPALKCEVLSASDGLPGTAAEFFARWGDPTTSDESSLVITRLEPGVVPEISVRPRVSEPTSGELLQIAAGNSGLRVQLQCDVTPNGTDLFQLPLRVSEEVVLDEVLLTRSGQRIPVRWSQPHKNSLQVFFGQGLADEIRLIVRGHVPRNDSASYSVPRIAGAAAASTQRVQIHREDDVLLHLEGLTTGVRADGQTLAPSPAQWPEQVVGLYQMTPQSFGTARLVVKPNQVQTAGQTLTMLGRDADNWWITFVCRLTVEQGELGVLQLKAPANWAGPLEVQAAFPATVETSAVDDSRSSVSVRFREPVQTGSVLELRLRGRMMVGAATSIAVPQIVLDTAIRGPRYVLVPSQIDGQSVAWIESGARPTLLPAEFATLNSGPEPGRCFEITASPFRVALRPPQVERQATTVRLADTRAEIGPFGGQLIVTQMIVVSPDLTEVTLELPANQELLTVAREDKPALIRRLDERRWRLSLGPTQLPQSVETVCSSRRAEGIVGSLCELNRPRLLDGDQPIPVEVGLWTVSLPWPSSKWSVERAAVVTATEQAAVRLDRLASIVETSTPAAIDLPLPEGRDWYLPWAARLKAVQRRALSEVGEPVDVGAVLQVTPPSDEQLAKASEQLDTWIEQCDEIFAVSDVLPLAESPSSQAIAAPWERAEHAAGDSIYCVADGDSGQLLIDLSSQTSTAQSRIRDVLLVLGAAAAAIALMRVPATRDVLWRWPHAAAFLLGMACWAWLWPSWIGLLIAVTSLWFALRPGWPGRGLRSEGSTLVSSGGAT